MVHRKENTIILKEGKLEISLNPRKRILEIIDIKLKSYNPNDLESALRQILSKYNKYCIIFPQFHHLEEEYKVNMEVLRKLKFFLIEKRLTFTKEIEKVDYNFVLSYKKIDEKNKKIAKQIYFSSMGKSENKVIYGGFSKNKAFERALNQDNPKWNYVVYSKNNPIGILILRITRSNKGNISFIGIIPKYQGKGFSKEMLKKAEFEFYNTNLKEWVGSTGELNAKMIATFKRAGLKKKFDMFFYQYTPRN